MLNDKQIAKYFPKFNVRGHVRTTNLPSRLNFYRGLQNPIENTTALKSGDSIAQRTRVFWNEQNSVMSFSHLDGKFRFRSETNYGNFFSISYSLKPQDLDLIQRDSIIGIGCKAIDLMHTQKKAPSLYGKLNIESLGHVHTWQRKASFHENLHQISFDCVDDNIYQHAISKCWIDLIISHSWVQEFAIERPAIFIQSRIVLN